MDDDDGHQIPPPGYSPAEVLTETNQPDDPPTGEGDLLARKISPADED